MSNRNIPGAGIVRGVVWTLSAIVAYLALFAEGLPK
jgi:hypothetical protein